MVVSIPTANLIKIEELKPYQFNVKNHPPEQINALAKIIQEFPEIGFAYPIIIDDNNVIIAGHGRLEAAKKLNMLQVPYIRTTEMSDDRKKAYMIMENELTNMANWNRENLKFALQNIQFDFKPYHMDFTRYASLKEETDEIPEPPEIPKSKLGDIYQLGRHRIMCGDCTLAHRVLDQDVDLLVSDPPYGVDYANKNIYLNSIAFANRIETPIQNDNIEDYQKWFSLWLKDIPLSKTNAYYLTISDQKLLELSLALLENKYKISQYLVWKKNNHVLGRQDYANIHELIVYGWHTSGHHEFYGDFQTTVWEIDRPNSSPLHPTMKPLELLSRMIKNSSKENGIIYDPFLGSGSTLIACEQTNRICYGMEIDPHYIDVIITRWENFTKQKALLLPKV